jgi:hypothetical protein
MTLANMRQKAAAPSAPPARLAAIKPLSPSKTRRPEGPGRLSREELIDPERLKQLVIEMIWFGFLVTIIWIVLRVLGL